MAGTDLEVSNVAIGTYKLGIKSGAAEAVDLLCHAYRQHAINFIDTSDNYPAAEMLIGKALQKSLPRSDVVIAGKTGLAGSEYEAREFAARGVDRDTTPARIRRKLEDSLMLMGIDEMDLYQVHVHDEDVGAVEVASVMSDLICEGKVRHWGVCNYTDTQVQEIVGVTRQAGLLEPISYQQYHNMYDRPFASDIDVAKSLGMSVLAFSPLMKGALTKINLAALRKALAKEGGEEDKGELKAVQDLEYLQELAELRGYNLQQLAIAWQLKTQQNTVPILGTYRREDLDELAEAFDWQPDEEILLAIEEAKRAINS